MAETTNFSSGNLKTFGSRQEARAALARQRKAIPRSLASRLTPGGTRFVTCSLDPFHDSPVQPSGYPDLHSGKSFVSKVRLQFPVTRPAGVAAGNWDCMILALPLAFPSLFKQCKTLNLPNMAAFAAAAPDITLGPIQAFCAPSGTELWPTTGNGITFQANDMVVPNDVFSSFHVGPSRVICGGFEVHDNTNELNKQGGVTVFSQPNFSTPSATGLAEAVDNTYAAFYPSGLFAHTMPLQVFDAPPPSSTAAAVIGDTVNWQAKEGVYVPFRLETMDNPFVVRSQVPIQIKEVTQYGNLATGFISKPRDSGAYMTGDPLYGGTSTMHPLTMDYAQTTPFQTCGAIFTGLHQDASLTVTYICYVERAPCNWQTDLLSIVKPSPPYDPVAFQVLVNALRRLPIATKVGNNASGDWWDDVLSAIGGFATKAAPMLTMIPEIGPVAAAAAEGLGLAAYGGRSLGRQIQQSARAVKAAAPAPRRPPGRPRQPKSTK